MPSVTAKVTGTVMRAERYRRSAYGRERWRLGIEPSPGDGMTWYKTGPDASFPGIDPLALEGKQVTATIKGAVSQWITALAVHEEGP